MTMPRKSTRLETFDYRGCYRYFLTFCTFDRRRVFSCAEVVEPLRWQIQRVAAEQSFAVPAYCFMPDHLHLLVEGQQETSDARRFITRTKQTTGHWYASTRRERLWQRYSYDRVLRRSEDTIAVVRYIAANPVRAGLVAHPLDYPYSGSLSYPRSVLVDGT
jgi:putative transposase